MEARINDIIDVLSIYVSMVKDFIKQYPSTAAIAGLGCFDIYAVGYLVLNHHMGPVRSTVLAVSFPVIAILLVIRSSRPKPQMVSEILPNKDDWFASVET